jgi:hypothetical protein
MRVVRPFSPFTWRLVAHHRLARVGRLEGELELAGDPQAGDGQRLLHALRERGGAGVRAVEFGGEPGELLKGAVVVGLFPRPA